VWPESRQRARSAGAYGREEKVLATCELPYFP